MSELERTVTAGAAERVIRSYVGSKSERAALSRLLMHSDPLPSRCARISSLNLSSLSCLFPPLSSLRDLVLCI